VLGEGYSLSGWQCPASVWLFATAPAYPGSWEYRLHLLSGARAHLRPPTPDHGSTAYIFSQGPELTIVLWGFGLFCGCCDTEPAGLFLKRNEFTPRMTPTAAPPWGVWTLEQLPALHDPKTPDERTRLQGLFTAALHWIASYEQWATHTLGLNYRRRCIAGWSRTVVAAEAMAATWRQLAARWKVSPMKPEPGGGGDNAVEHA
jgi:hypothetical protein